MKMRQHLMRSSALRLGAPSMALALVLSLCTSHNAFGREAPSGRALQPVTAIAGDAASVHLLAVREVLMESGRAGEWWMSLGLVLKTPGTLKVPLKREILEHYLRTRTQTEFAADLAPKYADMISADDAHAALRALRHPAARTMVNVQLDAQAKGADSTRAVNMLPVADRVAINQIVETPDGQAWTRVLNATRAPFDMNRTLMGYERALIKRYQALDTAMRQLDRKPRFTPDDLPSTRVGVPTFDLLLDIYAAALVRAALPKTHFAEIMTDPEVTHALIAERLVTRDGLARGRAAVARQEQVMGQLVGELVAALAWRDREIIEILKHLPGWDPHAEKERFDWDAYLRRYSENIREQAANARRMLALAEARLGTTAVHDGTLTFQSAEDQATWRAMRDQCKQFEYVTAGLFGKALSHQAPQLAPIGQ